jgi:hypothetical protein
VSEGSDGQSASGPISGGKGDESFLSVARVQRAFMNMSGPNGEALTFYPKLSTDELFDLWKRASDKGPLPVIQVLTKRNLEMLPIEQKNKILKYCREKGYSEEKINLCFEQIFVPLIEKNIREAMDQMQFKVFEESSQVLPQFDGEHIFSLPPGAVGPENKMGPQGERGKITVHFKDEPAIANPGF